MPNSLEELKNQLQTAILCDFVKNKKTYTFWIWKSNSKLCFICDEPSKSEDDLGSFFVGNSGDMLAKMIEGSLKIKKEEVYTTNLVKCREQKQATFQILRVVIVIC